MKSILHSEIMTSAFGCTNTQCVFTHSKIPKHLAPSLTLWFLVSSSCMVHRLHPFAEKSIFNVYTNHGMASEFQIIRYSERHSYGMLLQWNSFDMQMNRFESLNRILDDGSGTWKFMELSLLQFLSPVSQAFF